MATRFSVISLGQQADIDIFEGGRLADNADALVGLSFGSEADPLLNEIRQFSPGSRGFRSGDRDAYDQGGTRDNFRIDGGPNQQFDAVSVYGATLTYTDGTTANISAVLFQDTEGNTYLAPEISDNADQAALEAKPIRSLQLDMLQVNVSDGLTGNREAAEFQVCFAAGARIATPKGEVRIEDLRPGDLVDTRDNGPQPLLWVGSRALGPDALAADPRALPVLIPRGRLGATDDLLVSQLHGMLWDGDRLVRAKHLPGLLPGVRIARGKRRVTYMHMLLEHHQIVFANGVPSESFYPGCMAMNALETEAAAEVEALIPGLTAAALLRLDPARLLGPRARPFAGPGALRREPALG